MHEEALQPFGADAVFDRARVKALAADLQSGLVDVGGEYLQLKPPLRDQGLLEEHHRHRVGLFAGGAARYPDAQAVADVLRIEQRRQHLFGKSDPGLLLAEEFGHADQQVRREVLHFGRRGHQVLQVVAFGRGPA
ncbi:MAG TPA: hypothetical protein PK177_03770 [Burkholderiaceae bacterium]|nr:hypothetical protein [Burkholderiaceae bacterium]